VKEDIPIILMTGQGDKISLEQVRKSGVRATLIKPVLKERLQTVLDVLKLPAISRLEPGLEGNSD
jgi:AmiR/NasT family two-component response regulator